MNTKITSIKLHSITRDKLASVGKKNQTYDEIINGLVDFWVKEGGDEK